MPTQLIHARDTCHKPWKKMRREKKKIDKKYDGKKGGHAARCFFLPNFATASRVFCSVISLPASLSYISTIGGLKG